MIGVCHSLISVGVAFIHDRGVSLIQEESKQRQREDEERRKEVSAKFQSTINDITSKMQEHHQRNQTLRQENLE